MAPDLVLCSTAVRARETLALVQPALPASTTVSFERRLYGAGAADLIDRLHELTDDVGSVMLVGHNPGLEELVLELAGAGDAALVERVETKFPTAGSPPSTSMVDGWTGVAPGTATLTRFVVPRDLDQVGEKS